MQGEVRWLSWFLGFGMFLGGRDGSWMKADMELAACALSEQFQFTETATDGASLFLG